MDEAVKELINAIKDMSPLVWEAALVRVQVNGWLDLGLAGMFLIVAIGLALLSRYFIGMTRAKADDSFEGIGLVCIVIGILIIVPILGNLYYGLLYLLSPEWSAIQLILEQVK